MGREPHVVNDPPSIRVTFWQNAGSSRRNSHVDLWRWGPENAIFTRLRVRKRFSYNEAVP
eukprot:3770176-Pyramimonas_sp.AAC.1